MAARLTWQEISRRAHWSDGWQIHFLEVVRWRFPVHCWLPSRACSQLLQTCHKSLTRGNLCLQSSSNRWILPTFWNLWHLLCYQLAKAPLLNYSCSYTGSTWKTSLLTNSRLTLAASINPLVVYGVIHIAMSVISDHTWDAGKQRKLAFSWPLLVQSPVVYR